MHRMPTKNPRITITLPPVTALQLRRLSELTGNSQSAMIGEILEGSEKVFDRMILVLEAAQQAKDAMKGRLAADMEAAQAKVEQHMGLVLEGFDELTLPLLDEAEAVKRRGARRSKGPTPMSNRGVRSDPKTPGKGRRQSEGRPSPSSNTGVKVSRQKKGVRRGGAI